MELPPPSQLIRSWRFWVACIAGALVLGLFGYAVASYVGQRSKPVETAEVHPVPAPAAKPAAPADNPSPSTQPAKVASYLNGRMVDPGTENVHPLAVMIENHPDARPQSGLGQAGLVVEAQAEGGITRFMAVFDTTDAIKVGPVRSARTYFVDIAEQLNAFYAHVGGNLDALDKIKADNVLDLDQFAVGSAAYHRDFSRNVALEHTMYSSTDLLRAVADKRSWSKTGDYQRWQFKDDPALADRPQAQTVNVSTSTPDFAVTWKYDRATNSYDRDMAGKPHIDADTGAQITAKTIILQTVTRTPTVTRINEHGWAFDTTGTGPAVVIQDGTAIKGTWKRDAGKRTVYLDASGKEIALTRGTIWLNLIHPESKVSY